MTFASAQEKKSDKPPKPVLSQSQEIWWMWNRAGNKLITMAEDFPEDQYNFKAQKDERMFGENLIHVASDDNGPVSVIKGSAVRPAESEGSLRKKVPTKTDIVKLIKQAVAEGAQVIKEQGDNGLVREYESPWASMMFHGSLGLLSTIEHEGEHNGQLVVYYRLCGMLPPKSRPRK